MFLSLRNDIQEATNPLYCVYCTACHHFPPAALGRGTLVFYMEREIKSQRNEGAVPKVPFQLNRASMNSLAPKPRPHSAAELGPTGVPL